MTAREDFIDAYVKEHGCSREQAERMFRQAVQAAQNEPRWALYKAQPDEDAYVAWSSIAEGPCRVGTRAQMAAMGYTDERLDRADTTGTSVMGTNWWGSEGYLIADQRGILRRERVVEYSRLCLDSEYDKAWDLLEPFDDEDEVRRD